MKLLGFSIILLFFATHHGLAQYTQIPDAEFEARLIAQGIDTEGTLDGQVLTDDIDHILILDVSTPFPPTYIQDLTGIEDFTNLEFLNFASNEITTVDLSNNVNLKTLVAKFNNLTTLDISSNLALEVLDITNCFPGTCDQENTISELDLSTNIELRSVFLNFYNQLSSLDLSNNGELESVTVSRNTILNSLNIKNGNNTNITLLNVIDNPLLECITVDDPVAATEGVLPPYDDWVVEPGVIFSKECILGLDDIFRNLSIHLVPNPTQNQFLIESSGELSLDFAIIYDIAGRVVFSEIVKDASMDISTLKSGVYFVALYTSQGTITKRIIKE